MKLIDNIFSSIYFLFKALNDGRHGDEMPIIGAIFTLTLLLSANVLTFFSASTVNKIKWLYYIVALVACSILVVCFYRKRRYVEVTKRFDKENNKGIYRLTTIVYVVLSVVVFAITR